MTREEQIRQAGIEYTIGTRPMCIGGGAFSEMADEMNRNKSFEEGAKWADEHPSEQVYTKKQLGEMGFPFTLNGDIVTPNELDEHYRRGIEYRKQKLIEKVCNQLEMRFDEYLVREVRKIMEE